MCVRSSHSLPFAHANNLARALDLSFFRQEMNNFCERNFPNGEKCLIEGKTKNKQVTLALK